MSRTRTRRYLEPLSGCFVGLCKYRESIYVSRSSTEHPLRGFVILTVLYVIALLDLLAGKSHSRNTLPALRLPYKVGLTEVAPRVSLIKQLHAASVLRTILRTYAGGCAEGKPVSLTQGGRLLEIAKSRDKRVRSIDDEIERGTLKPYPINKALAPVNDWYSISWGKRLLLVITNHHLFRSPCIV